MLYAFVLRDMLIWIADINAWPHPPIPDTEFIMYVVLSLLGIEGGARTVGALRNKIEDVKSTEKRPDNFEGP